MKRSKSVRLVLLGSVPFALVACDGQPQATREVRQTQHFSSVRDCVLAQVPSAICQDAFDDARERGELIAPRYLDLQRCEDDFFAGNCMVSRDNRAYVPIAKGLALTTQRTVPVQPEDEQPEQASSSSSGGGGGGGGGGHSYGARAGSSFWRWIGLDSTPEPRYFSETLYKERDGRGGSQLSTLSQQVEAGKTFSGANGGRFGISSPDHFTSTGNPLAGAHEVVSRGGFGSSSHSSWSFGS